MNGAFNPFLGDLFQNFYFEFSFDFQDIFCVGKSHFNQANSPIPRAM